MILIQEILVSDHLLSREFACHLDKCKGACCVGGDFGAPLDEEEISVLEGVFEEVRPFMEQAGIEAIESEGVFQLFDKPAFKGVTLREDRACAFVKIDSFGIAHCTIEEAWQAGATDFRKPVSCHLYPVRVKENAKTGFTALNYDKWELCKPACAYGKVLGVSVYKFVREALIRRFGKVFYDELDEIAQDRAKLKK